MKKQIALKSILGIATVGLLFSGYLSYTELVGKSCIFGCSYVLGYPSCVYGFLMYFAVFVISVLGLKAKK